MSVSWCKTGAQPSRRRSWTRIFEPVLPPGHRPGHRSPAAPGLGLAIAKEIVEAHGGCITARSADETVTFIVSLPETCQKNV